MTSFVVQNLTSLPGLLQITKGTPGGPSNLFGRVAVAANGKTVVPTTERYSAFACITMEDGNTYYSSTINLLSGTQTLTARMRVSGGTFSFEVEQSAGVALETITLVSTCRLPVTFYITATPVSPLGAPVLTTAVVVNQRDSVPVSTVESYSFRSIVNGITSESLDTTPGQTLQDQLVIQIYEDTVSFADWPSYSIRYA